MKGIARALGKLVSEMLRHLGEWMAPPAGGTNSRGLKPGLQ